MKKVNNKKEEKKENEKKLKEVQKKEVKNKTEKKQTKNDGKKISKSEKKFILKKPLIALLYVLIIVVISLISFVGIYIKDKNKMTNILPEYILGADINGARNIVVKVDDSTSTKKYDANGNELSSDSTETPAKTEEIPANDSSVLNSDNYREVENIIIKRLKAMKVGYYEIKCNDTDGRISVEVPENSDTDYIAQYCITKGEFKISDNDTNEVLLTNNDIKNAKVLYSTTTSGTTVYVTIQLKKDSIKKLEDISTKYVESKDSEGKDTTKKVKMTIDDSTIMTTYFSQKITDGQLQLSLGTSTSSSKIQEYLKNANNMTVLLNTNAMPVKYSMEVNRFVYSNITNNTLSTIIIVAGAIFVVLLAFMIVKHKMLGLLGAITNIGLLAILLLVIRFSNVVITASGLASIALVTILEYILLMRVLNVIKKELDKENEEKEIKNTIKNSFITLVPIAILAIVFSLTTWEALYSVGTILFWGIILIVLYSLLTLKILFMYKKQNREKKQEFHQI